jgi:hypothetical protein
MIATKVSREGGNKTRGKKAKGSAVSQLVDVGSMALRTPELKFGRHSLFWSD